jgi:Fur family ferric uptake transcriptional regulator
LKQAGLKVTLPRTRILEMLREKRHRHLSAEDIYKALLDAREDIGLATVYRVLTQFEAAGLVKRHYFDSTQSVFELNEGLHHDHIVCLQCGAIAEFCDDLIEKRQRAIAEKLGFELMEHRLILYGNCTRVDCPNRPR